MGHRRLADTYVEGVSGYLQLEDVPLGTGRRDFRPAQVGRYHAFDDFLLDHGEAGDGRVLLGDRGDHTEVLSFRRPVVDHGVQEEDQQHDQYADQPDQSGLAVLFVPDQLVEPAP